MCIVDVMLLRCSHDEFRLEVFFASGLARSDRAFMLSNEVYHK